MVGPPRRSMTPSNVNNTGSPGNPSNGLLPHRPNYRYVSAGALYKSVQEGMEMENSLEGFQEDAIANSYNQQMKNGLVVTARLHTAPGVNHSDKPQEIRSLTLGRSPSMIRNRTKVQPTPGDKAPIVLESKEVKLEPKEKDVHPGERQFPPAVICRYPPSEWTDAEAFPTFLPMFCFPADLSFKLSDERPPTTYHSFVLTHETGGRSYAMCVTIYERLPKRMHRQLDAICQRWTRSHMSESEIEYARAIKTKISRERKVLHGLQMQLREENTMGQKAKQAQLKRDILDSEEKLTLLNEQMNPWKGLYVEIEDAWMPRYVKNLIHEVSLPPFGKLEVGITINNKVIYASRPALNSVPIVKNVILSEGRVIFLSSYLGMLTLASESFLYLLFPLYWQGVYIPILPSALMTCLQAPVPYIIGVERRSRDSDFPPEDACVVDLDKGTVDIQLAPVQLPPRQRRKLIQSLEQYAPTSAIRRSSTTVNPALGPPVYVQEAFPHSRLTLFCGVSRAPRSSRRESTRSLPAVQSGSSSANSSVTYSGNGSSRDLGLASGSGESSKRTSAETMSLCSVTTQPSQPSQPPLYSKVVGGMARSASEGILDKELDPKDAAMNKDALSRSESMIDSSPISQHSASESFKSASRKVLSPTRTRSNMFDSSKKHDGANSNGVNGQSNGNSMPVHPSVSRHNSSHGNNINAIAASYDGPWLRHRASFNSIDSSNSSIMSKSPVSTMTSNTMGSINGVSSTLAVGRLSGDDDPGLGKGNGESGRTTLLNKEGHVLAAVSSPFPMSLLNCRCGVCIRGLASNNVVYRCEGCSLYLHAGCLDELLYPCVPRGFDESGVCWSVLQMWAGLMKGYRSGMITGTSNTTNQQQQWSPNGHHNTQQQQQHFQQQGQGTHQRQGHAKQPSNAGSEGDREGGRDRLSWASFQRWTGRNGTVNGSNGNGKAPGPFSPSNRHSANLEQMYQQQHQHQQLHRQSSLNNGQPGSRARNATDNSSQSDTMRFHRDVFMKGVDKEAKPFMSMFTESQAFAQFIQDRIDRSSNDPEIMFFDEVIKAKINRSRFRIGKEETKFLDDPSYSVQKTIKATPPSGEIQIHENNDVRRFPTTLDPAYF
ncbi:hypothetical protein BGZ98_001683 [Dissophora globulifera]|nr:hypothetical protein BGZ98_001683 [Dissophora globulifera]